MTSEVDSAPWFEVTSLTVPAQAGLAWTLDAPRPGARCELVAPGQMRVRGWVVSPGARRPPAEPPLIALRVAAVSRCYRLNQWRGDVLEKVLGLVPSEHRDWTCGFDLAVAMFDELEIGVDRGGQLVWLNRLRRCDAPANHKTDGATPG